MIQGNIITALSIDDLVFDNINFILQEVQGLEMPLVRLPRYNLPGQSGAFISNALYGERPIKIRGTINAPDNNLNTYLTNRTTLINNLSFLYDTGNRPIARTFSVTLINGQTLTAGVYVDTPLQMKFSENQVGYEEFFITLVAPDFNLYSQTPIVTTIQMPVQGGVPIPTAIPLSLAPSSGGMATINNIGALPAQPTIRLVAPLDTPYIINQTTGLFMELKTNLAIGQNDIIIDCANQIITQGNNNITGIQSVDSNFWNLLSGNNLIGFNAASGTGYCVITFTPTLLGI